MAALKLDMTIPLGDAGHVHLTIDIGDLGALSADNRAFVADTCVEVCAFAGRVLAPYAVTAGELADGTELPPATIHDPSASVLNGVTGSRIRDKL